MFLDDICVYIYIYTDVYRSEIIVNNNNNSNSNSNCKSKDDVTIVGVVVYAAFAVIWFNL